MTWMNDLLPWLTIMQIKDDNQLFVLLKSEDNVEDMDIGCLGLASSPTQYGLPQFDKKSRLFLKSDEI